jgi:hypothetical protein
MVCPLFTWFSRPQLIKQVSIRFYVIRGRPWVYRKFCKIVPPPYPSCVLPLTLWVRLNRLRR